MQERTRRNPGGNSGLPDDLSDGVPHNGTKSEARGTWYRNLIHALSAQAGLPVEEQWICSYDDRRYSHRTLLPIDSRNLNIKEVS